MVALIFSNLVHALPECEGNDIEGAFKKFSKVRKGTNCHGNFSFKGAIDVGGF